MTVTKLRSAAEIKTAFITKLKSSDLNKKDAGALKFAVVQNPQKLSAHFFDTPAFKIPYFNASGKFTGFYRIRYLASTKKGMLANTNAKDRRYDQPASELPELYLPPVLPKRCKWADIFSDPAVPVCFTEGELKSACATKHGIPTIGLGGVWNFKAKKSGLLMLPIFDKLVLKGRDVFIVFDSDAVTNPQVLYAQYKFAQALFDKGAKPYIINIPAAADGSKQGIDDFIVANGIKAYKTLLDDPDSVTEFQFVKELLKLNGEIALVSKPVAIVHYATGQLLKKSDAQLLYASSRMMAKKIKAGEGDAEDEVKYNEVNTFDEWLKWPQRTTVWGVSYEPGQPRFVTLDGRRHYNTWQGWGCEPVKGDVSLWHWLLDNVCAGMEPAHKKWFIQWCAFPLQNPGVKMYSSCIFFGQMKGTGKSLLGLTLKSIYGEQNSAEITDTQLADERNVYAAEKQFILGNEVTGSDKRSSMVGRLRNLITQHSVIINKKYQPDYTIRDTINYFFTSNLIDAVYMEDDERRFFVHEVIGMALMSVNAAMVDKYDRWLKSGAAAPALFHHLLGVDLTGFNPFGPAPQTVAKAKMVEASRTEVEAWCFKLKEDPDTCLRVGDVVLKFNLYRLKDLVDLYSTDNFRKPYEKVMSNALRKAGFKKAARDQSAPTKDGHVNLWCIRDESYALLGTKEVGMAYDKERDMFAGKKFAQIKTQPKGKKK